MLNFACDPDFFAMAMSYEDRDRWEGDIHIVCDGEARGQPCSCWCHTPEGEAGYYGPTKERRVRFRDYLMRTACPHHQVATS